MTIKALILDIDGTLIDSNWAHANAWCEAFARHGYEFDWQTVHDQIGKGGDNLVPSLVPEVSGELQQALDHAHGEIYKSKYRPQVQPFPGARDLIEHARSEGQDVVLASSAGRVDLDFYLDLLDARDLLTDTTSKDDVDSSKPDPDIFSAALDKLGFEPGEAVVVGDTPYDISAASKCGLATIAVRSGGFSDEQLAGAVAIYDDVAELLAHYESSPISSRSSKGSGGS